MKQTIRERIGRQLLRWGRAIAGLPSTGRRSYAGGFNAARVDRTTGDWNLYQPTSADWHLRMELRKMRARARDLGRNNDYAAHFLKMVASNVVGHRGIRLQVRALDANGQPLAGVSKRVETEFEKWGRRATASITGKQSWLQLQRMVATMLARDGEVLLRKRYVRGNPWGFALQVIDADFLDDNFSQAFNDGRKVVMGVELDADDRPTAYYLRTPPNDLWLNRPSSAQRVRVPADEIIHVYDQQEPRQTRGVPWLYVAMFRLKRLGAYEEAELIAANIAAAKMGFYRPPAESGYTGDDAPKAPLIDGVEPGQFQELPSGYEIQTVDFQHPNSNYGEFVRAALYGVAAGLGVSYAGLTGDLRQANFSSTRTGMLDERANWRVIQSLVAEQLHEEVYRAWREAAYMAGRFKGLSRAEYEATAEPRWQPRGWPWVDPLKDLTATEKALSLGLVAPSDVVADLYGEDYDDVLARRKQDRETAAGYGETFNFGGASAPEAEAGADDAAEDAAEMEDSGDEESAETNPEN